MNPRIDAAIRLIEKRCCTNLTAASVAAQVGLSRSRFEHLLGRETGKNFRSLLREARLHAATELLQHRDLSVRKSLILWVTHLHQLSRAPSGGAIPYHRRSGGRTGGAARSAQQ
jgi:AraC-like DNA-binding protein